MSVAVTSINPTVLGPAQISFRETLRFFRVIRVPVGSRQPTKMSDHEVTRERPGTSDNFLSLRSAIADKADFAGFAEFH